MKVKNSRKIVDTIDDVVLWLEAMLNDQLADIRVYKHIFYDIFDVNPVKHDKKYFC